MMRLLLVQVTSLLATHFLWFGAILPCLWKDRGFPAILQLFNVNHLKTSTFDTDLPISSFAVAASFLHTAIVLLGIGVGTLVRRFQDSNRTKASTVHAFCVGLCMGICTSGLLYFVSFHLFQTSFIGNWQGGFQYAMYFFKETVGGADFAHVAAMSLTIECTTAYLIRVCTKQYNGVFPKFAENIIPKSLFSFVVCYGTFRKLLTPHVVKSLAAATGMFSKENIAESGGVSLPHLKLGQWAALAACLHTLCLALGMTFHALTKDVIGSMTSQACRTTLTQRTNGLLRFIVFFVGATAFFTTIQWWLSHGYALEFVQKSTIMQGGFFQHKETGDGGGSSPSQASVAVAGGFYTLAFLMGAVISENPLKLLKNQKCTQTMNQKCTQCVTRNLRLRPAPTFKRATKVGDGTNTNSGVTEGLLLTGTAVLLAMYVADHQLLGVTIVHYLELTKDFLNTTVMKTIPQLLPNVWHYLHDRFSRDELFFMTLPVLLISEIPLVLFTVLDYLKLKYFDQWRIHYSKIDRKRPRTYPTNPELWKAFKVHCVNFFGIYCSVFIVGVGFACKTNIIPYSFAKTLPKYWVLEFLFCSFFADVLFYVLHRAVHSKGLYQRLHKMHHEWIYTMALAHHYMDPLEATIFMLPPIIPPMLMGSHITIVWAIVLCTQFGGIMGHSAFLLPIISSSRWTTWIPFLNSQYHDLHHLRFNVNYGAVWPVVDMLFGTYREEPIVYIDGFAVLEGKDSTSNTKADEEDESSKVHATAEAASKDDALPDIPWYVRPFASSLPGHGTTAPKRKIS